ncbi:hypothetical protein Golob_002588, partial [Gossypium lobatum]|nr:hypothetical protein [Gossypium lobatum]
MNGHLATKTSFTLFSQISTISKPHHDFHLSQVRLFAFFALLLFIDTAFAKNAAITKHYKFDVGPRIIAREDDRLIIKVVNHVQYNATLH